MRFSTFSDSFYFEFNEFSFWSQFFFTDSIKKSQKHFTIYFHQKTTREYFAKQWKYFTAEKKRQSTGRPKNSLPTLYTTENSVRVFRWMCAQHVLRGVGFSRFLLSLHHIKRFIFFPECSVKASGEADERISYWQKIFFLLRLPFSTDFCSSAICRQLERLKPFFMSIWFIVFWCCWVFFSDDWDDDMFNLFINV